MKIFFDTNVLVSAFISREGACADVFRGVLDSQAHIFVTGEVVLMELERILKPVSNIRRTLFKATCD